MGKRGPRIKFTDHYHVKQRQLMRESRAKKKRKKEKYEGAIP